MGVRRLCWRLEQTAVPTNALVPFPTLTTGRVLRQQDWGPPTTRGRPAHTMFLSRLTLSTSGEPNCTY